MYMYIVQLINYYYPIHHTIHTFVTTYQSVHCILYSVYCILYSLYTVYSTPPTTVCSALCIIYILCYLLLHPTMHMHTCLSLYFSVITFLSINNSLNKGFVKQVSHISILYLTYVLITAFSIIHLNSPVYSFLFFLFHILYIFLTDSLRLTRFYDFSKFSYCSYH